MEGKTIAPDAVVIAQDDETNLRIQAMLQGGRRHVDIRIWRRGPTGFAPSRTGVVLEASDLDALQQGIRELLEVSDNGQRVARVVWDGEDGRRLRAETEPFGTRYLARLGFWQRARDSWRPAGEDLVVSADRLRIVQDILHQFRPWLAEVTPAEQPTDELELPPKREAPDLWPTPGADWLTIENERIALHPRGYRITASAMEQNGVHRVVLRQWRRQDSLWLPDPSMLSLTALDLDALLADVARIVEGNGNGQSAQELQLSDGSHVRIDVDGERPLLLVTKLPSAGGGRTLTAEPCLTLPEGSLGQFGRLLVESWGLLVRTLSETERHDLERAEHVLEIPIDPRPAPSAMDSSERPIGAEPVSPLASEAKTALPEEPEPEEVIPLGELSMDHHRVALTLQDGSRLRLAWEDRRIDVPAGELEDLLEHLRQLYYEGLRGYRGTTILLDGPSPLSAHVQNIGMSLYFTLRMGVDGKTTSLSVPASEIPAFLDAAGSALAQS